MKKITYKYVKGLVEGLNEDYNIPYENRYELDSNAQGYQICKMNGNKIEEVVSESRVTLKELVHQIRLISKIIRLEQTIEKQNKKILDNTKLQMIKVSLEYYDSILIENLSTGKKENKYREAMPFEEQSEEILSEKYKIIGMIKSKVKAHAFFIVMLKDKKELEK